MAAGDLYLIVTYDDVVLTSPVGQQLFDALEPWQTDDLAIYCQAIGSMVDPLASIIQEVGVDGDPAYVPSYGILFDPDTCPTEDLPFLGQFVGVTIPVGASEATARSLVKAEAGMNRGTPASIMAAIERSISTTWAPSTTYAAGVLVTYGSPPTFYKVTTSFTSGATFDATDLAVVDPRTQYQLIERTSATGPDAYWFTVIVRPEQLTPTSDGTAITAAINAVKPGGVLLNLIIADATPWSGMSGSWASLTGTWQQQ